MHCRQTVPQEEILFSETLLQQIEFNHSKEIGVDRSPLSIQELFRRSDNLWHEENLFKAERQSNTSMINDVVAGEAMIVEGQRYC